MSEDIAVRENIAVRAGRVFTPAAPVSEQTLFAGRRAQLRKVVDAAHQVGQHAIVFGERGVGKTSLTNILDASLRMSDRLVVSARVNCDTTDTFDSIWLKIFGEIELVSERRIVGFQGRVSREVSTMAEQVASPVTPNSVRKALSHLSDEAVLAIVVDEFDRARDPRVRSLFADTIKNLSDYSVPATLVLVGVADSVSELLADHQSIERALVQVHMPRMSLDELNEIIRRGLESLGLRIEVAAQDEIAALSRGLPHYTHLLALHAVREALDQGRDEIDRGHVAVAIRGAIEGAQLSTQNAYHMATASPRRDSLHARVLLACALASTDEMGSFVPADLREPMEMIMGRPYDIANYIHQVNSFCTEERGTILQRTGVQRRFRYRFRNPLMQPFVMMHGITNQLLSPDRVAPKRG